MASEREGTAREGRLPAEKQGRPARQVRVSTGGEPGSANECGGSLAETEGSGTGAADVACGTDASLRPAVPEPWTGRQLVVPSSEQLELALSQANTLEELVHFEKMVAVMKAAGDQFRFAIDEAIRIASFDLVTRRKIGCILLQIDRRGGDRSKKHAASLLERLLQELGKDKVKRCRAIARLEESCFGDYLNLLTGRHEIPTEAGALRYARSIGSTEGHPARARSERRTKVAATRKLVLSRAVLDCVRRVLGDIDVCIGDVEVKCRVRLIADTVHLKQLRGTVLVAECLYPADWLPKLAALRRNASVDAVLVALPVETSAAWFAKLLDGQEEWACWFPTGVLPPLMLAYLGHRESFKAACAQNGPTVRNL